MRNLIQRVFCPECGAMRICNHRSRFAVCPNGHGRLVPRFTETERCKAIAKRLPRAWRVGRKAFVIDGYDNRFVYQNGPQPATPDATVGSNEVLARYVTRARTLIRVFVRKDPRKT
jgi:hypothetical protein